MISFNLTALTRPTPFFQRNAKTREIFTQFSFKASTFNSISRFSSKISPQTTALQYFKKKALAEMNTHFVIDEDHEMETQPFYLSSDENEIDSVCSPPLLQLPNNVPDTLSAITQLIAAQHEQLSLSDTSAPQYPITPSTSLISDDEDDDRLTPVTGNPAQFLPHTPNRHPIPIQLCQQLTPIPDTPESLTPKNRGQPEIFRPYNFPNEPSSTILNNIPIITTVTDGFQNLTSATQRMGDRLFGMRQIL